MLKRQRKAEACRSAKADGLAGAELVWGKIEKMADKLVIRQATLEDRRAIWEWWNDPVTRQMMKKNDYVPWEEHCTWYEKVLEDKDRILCVGLVADQKIGNVRFDLNADGVYEVSINLNPLFRGKGYAAPMLTESIGYLTRIRSVKKLFATLKKINTPSQKSFAKAGFVFVEDPKHYYPGMEEFISESEFYCVLDLDNKGFGRQNVL